ncbi:MAG TPA: PEP-utilizing enzyme, partial [Thermomicrobiales bacterium]|nr:PEP-utilizing enzyme [Thermomicrobiales bacterium]
MSAPTRIPLPPHLSPEWEQPEDADGFWTQDRMHFPDPISHLDDSLVRNFYDAGMNHGFATYAMPLRASARRFWTHHYLTMMPLQLSHDELVAMEKRSEQAFGETMGQLQHKWETAWLPEIRQTIDAWESYDLPGATTAEIADHVDDVVETLKRLSAIHFEIAFPAMLPLTLFEELYVELFDEADRLVPYKLLQGMDNKTVEGGLALWRLSQQAAATPSVRRIVEEVPADQVVAALQTSDEGRVFLADLSAYLDEYGRRSDFWWDVSRPSWIEDPSPAIEMMKGYLARPERNPDLEQAALAAEREQLVAEARERLAMYPQAVRDQFEFLLQAAREGTVLSEDHGYWLDFRAASDARQVFVEAGRRLASAGAIANASDVVHLTQDEIRGALRAETPPDLRQTVAERAAEIERYRGVELPPAVGVQPPGAPSDNPGSRTFAKFFGVPPQASDDPSVLHGAAGSAGVVRGPARIVRSLNDADKAQPGDVLVAETTAPPWTPLFAPVAAVVTDTGGVLSH